MRLAEFLVMLIEGYAAAGLLFAALFLPRAAARMDPGLGHSVVVRLVILPGVMALWPLFAVRWVRGTSAPDERNPHRDKAARR